MARLHTFSAYRVLHRPDSQDEYHAHVRDLVGDILDQQVAANDLDIDGTPLMTLALRDWSSGSLDRNTSLLVPIPDPVSSGSFQFLPKQAQGWWQLPALAFLWMGGDPFAAWPTGKSGAPKDPKEVWSCPVLEAIRVRAVDTLKAFLKSPHRFPPEAFNQLRIGPTRTPLLHWLAARAFNVPTLKVLLADGMNPNETNPEGQTSLFFAQDAQAVTLLLHAGAFPFHRDASGQTAADFWTSRLGNVTSLLEAFQKYTSSRQEHDTQPTGTVVVGASQMGSWKSMSAALAATDWDPLSPVNSAVNERRLLPEVAIRLGQTLTEGTVRYRPLKNLLETKPFASAWRADEKAWAACFYWTVLQSNSWDVSMASSSIQACAQGWKKLMADDEVRAALPGVARDFLTSAFVEGPASQLKFLARWMTALPDLAAQTDPSVWSLIDVWLTPQAQEYHKPVDTGLYFKAVQEGLLGSLPESCLLALLNIRLKQNLVPDLVSEGVSLEEADEAWRQAWEALPKAPGFPMQIPWIVKGFEKMSAMENTAEKAAQWKEWSMLLNFGAGAAPSRKPRF